MKRPSDVRQTVSGVAMINPTGPHSHPQKTAETRMPIDEMPVLLPYNQGSNTLLLTTSFAINRPITSMGCVQPAKTASDTATGMTAPSHGPIYGINRRI